MRPQMPSAEQVAMLPALLVVTTPPQWQDQNGHINVRHYLELYDQAAWPLFATLGVDERYFKEQLQGVFDLQHHIWYLSELHVGDEVSVHARFIARSAKRFHGAMFIVNRSRGVLSSAFEYLSTGADLRTRRAAPLMPSLAAGIDALIAEQQTLPWQAPVCGSIAP